ncbi:MAG: hypothetical protein ACKOBW_10640 [Planctomycetota bacterium]
MSIAHHKVRCSLTAWVGSLVLGVVGCSPNAAPVATTPSPPAAPTAAAPVMIPGAATDPALQPAGVVGGAESSPIGGGEATGETERVAAAAGVGIKGRSLDQHEGLIVTPAKTFFTAKERIAFEIAVPHALNLYKALNGEAPKSQEEFMAKIVTENNIQLPKLPEGHRYVYDPATEQLLVERPKKQ